MKRKLGAAIFAAALAAAVALPAATAAGPAGRSGGSGPHFGAAGRYQEPIRTQESLRLRDGSCCIDPAGPGAGTTEKRGFTHGPGDGTGNSEGRPMDGRGYGSPSNR